MLKLAPGVLDPLMFYFGYTWMAGFYLLILLASLLWPETLLGRVLRVRALRWLGLISYGAYLFHEVMLAIVFGLALRKAPEIIGFRDAVLTIVALGVTLGVSWLSWTYFEQWFVREGHARRYEYARTDGRERG